MTYDVVLAKLPPKALFELQGDPKHLGDWVGVGMPEGMNVAVWTQQGQIIRTGPKRWLLSGDLSGEAALFQTLRPSDCPPEISIVCISDTLAFWAISGPDAEHEVSIARPLDLHPSVFPDIGATFTEAFGQRALILRPPSGFELAMDRSYAVFVDEYLAHITA